MFYICALNPETFDEEVIMIDVSAEDVEQCKADLLDDGYYRVVWSMPHSGPGDWQITDEAYEWAN